VAVRITCINKSNGFHENPAVHVNGNVSLEVIPVAGGKVSRPIGRMPLR
jgi:hypothetical protein